MGRERMRREDGERGWEGRVLQSPAYWDRIVEEHLRRDSGRDPVLILHHQLG